jgi:murein DD-endopeptidase MepM/ murein hydrolase activator NlpD
VLRAAAIRVPVFRIVGGIVVTLALTASVPSGRSATCWRPPVEGRVVDPFREPTCRWCAGNRGLEYRVGNGTAVHAAAAGTVTFSGSVAGVRYVVVALDNGWRHTYGRLTSTRVGVGDPVVMGSVIGRVSAAFFFGLRIGDAYADPAPFMGVVVGRPRLIPTDGSPARPSPSPTLRCAGVSSLGGRWQSSVPV